VRLVRRGTNWCAFCAFGNNLFDQLGRFWGFLTHKRGDL
jgi:hypothetical protein